MAGNIFGTLFRVASFGESHGKAIGVIIDGCPAGLALCENDIQAELDRRKSASYNGTNPAVTARAEQDRVSILSGVFKGVTLGTPIALRIENADARPADYEKTADIFRPGHADHTWQAKYGVRDYRGGGRASGRETAARVAAGAVAQLFLKKAADVKITAYTIEAGGVRCPENLLPPKTVPDTAIIEQNPLRAPDAATAALMCEHIEALKKCGNSCGGIVECLIEGVPAGWGEPVFDKLDAELAKAVVSIGAVKGIEFGAGFAGCKLTGSQWNDSIRACDCGHSLRFETNHSGGISGGISDGNTIVFRAAIKPVPGIFLPQKSVKMIYDRSGTQRFENTDIVLEGRYDVCLCPRIVPVIESMAALCLADMYLRAKNAHIGGCL